MDNNDDYIFLSAITEKNPHNDINCQVGDSYNVDCKSYSISRENRIATVFPVSKSCITSYQATGPFCVYVEGKMKPAQNPDIISLLEHAAVKTDGFTVNINGKEFNNMVISSYNYIVSDYGDSLFLKLKFTKVVL